MKILIAYWQILEPDINSGSLRLYETTRMLKEAGHHIVFLQSGTKYNRYLSELGVETPFDIGTAYKTSREFRQLLQQHEFDVAILSPYETYHRLAPYIKKTIPGCTLILDTIDLFHVRFQRMAELSQDPKDFEVARQTYDAEWQCMKDADSVWVVTKTEQKIIASGVNRVHVIPNVHRPATINSGFDEREGIVFLGGYDHAPNVDAVRYFVKEILPLIRTELPGVPVIIAGSNPPAEFQKYASEYGIHVTGYIPDHRSILNSCRVGIAPLRYGAGMKGKIGEYLSCGLPCVTTSIGAEGMNFHDGVEVLIADDPVGFANKVIAAYTDRTCWQMLSDNGRQYIQQYLSPAVLKESLEEALCQACAENPRRHHFQMNQAQAEKGLLTIVKNVGSKLRKWF